MEISSHNYDGSGGRFLAMGDDFGTGEVVQKMENDEDYHHYILMVAILR